MSFRLRSWNEDRLVRRVPERILKDYGDIIAVQLQNEIASSQFPWPRDTLRSGGGRTRLVKRGKRDIIDSGQFADSQTPPKVASEDGKPSLRIGWTAPYATDIFKGSSGEEFVSNRGVVRYGDQPPRDWIAPALKAQPFEPYFRKRWQELEGMRGQ